MPNSGVTRINLNLFFKLYLFLFPNPISKIEKVPFMTIVNHVLFKEAQIAVLPINAVVKTMLPMKKMLAAVIRVELQALHGFSNVKF